MPHRSFPFGLVTLVIIVLGLVAGIATKGQFKDIFVSITSSSPSPKPSNAASALPSATATAKNDDDTKTLGENTTAKPSPSGTKHEGTSTTKVTVNGKDIPADANGNVEYHESNDSSNVDVSINNSSKKSTTLEQSSSIKTEIKVNANTDN